MNFESIYIKYVIEILLQNTNARRATAYESTNYTIKATRQRPYNKRDKAETFIVTMGRPNYEEREFIKLAKKAGESFPIKKIQLKFWPKKKK